MSTEDRFKNRKEALAWLQSKGQISAGKFYQDCEAGKITVAADKTVSKFKVAEYADRLFNQHKQAPKSVDQEDRKRQLEIEKLEQEVEKGRLANRKEDEKWLYKEDAWAQMAALIGTLRDSIRHQFHVGSVAVIHAAGGDAARGPEVYEQTEELISRAFNEVVNAGRIEGMFAKGEEE
jgi:hypothetical protein